MRRKRALWVVGLLGAALLVATALLPSFCSYYLPKRAVRIVPDEVYVPGSADPKHRLDWYLPATNAASAGGLAPVVVFIHGGFWRPMDRRFFQPLSGLFGGVGVALANRGIPTAVVSYRQHPQARIADALADLGAAVRHVAESAAARGGDRRRLFVVGHSAGAMMTALLALKPDVLAQAGVDPQQIRGWVCLAGVYDLPRVLPALDRDLQDPVRASAPPVTATALPGDDSGLLALSPERLVRPGLAPFLLLVGSREVEALRGEHDHMTQALRAAGAQVRSQILDGQDHMDLVMQLWRPGAPVLAELMRFFDENGGT